MSTEHSFYRGSRLSGSRRIPVICDGCNTEELEHACDGDNAVVGGKATGKSCECICNAIQRMLPESPILKHLN